MGPQLLRAPLTQAVLGWAADSWREGAPCRGEMGTQKPAYLLQAKLGAPRGRHPTSQTPGRKAFVPESLESGGPVWVGEWAGEPPGHWQRRAWRNREGGRPVQDGNFQTGPGKAEHPLPGALCLTQ